VLRWILSGFRGSMVSHVIAAYIARNRASRTYLQPGDVVTIRVDRLGALTNQVAG
jgi:2-keto-4-pentenoate hydratase/2-oxohepta-3-ene-1,7-dioic acid hydratase in catechol pathway